MGVHAAAELAQIARRAGDVGLQGDIGAAVGSSPNRIGRAENAHDRAAERDRKMHRPGIVGHGDGRAADERRKLGQGRLAGEVYRSRSKRRHLVAKRALTRRADQRHRKTLLQKVPRHRGEAFAAPLLGFPDRAGRERHKLCVGDAVMMQEGVDAIGRRARNRKGEIGGAVVEPEHRSDGEIAVDRVHLERGQRDEMRVGKPASFAGALPGVLARFIRKFARHFFPAARDRFAETDPHRRRGCPCAQSAAQLTLQIEDEVITGGAQPRGQARGIRQWRETPRPGPFLAREFEDVIDRRMRLQEFGDRRRHQPIDLRGRITAPQLVQHRECVHHVADGRQLDQQNLAEVAR